MKKKSNAWNIRRLGNGLFDPSTQRIILKIVGFVIIGIPKKKKNKTFVIFLHCNLLKPDVGYQNCLSRLWEKSV